MYHGEPSHAAECHTAHSLPGTTLASTPSTGYAGDGAHPLTSAHTVDTPTAADGATFTPRESHTCSSAKLSSPGPLTPLFTHADGPATTTDAARTAARAEAVGVAGVPPVALGEGEGEGEPDAESEPMHEPEALEERVPVNENVPKLAVLLAGVEALALAVEVGLSPGVSPRRVAMLRPRKVMDDRAASASPASHSVDS